jgi:ParB family chromosome partitioning protein
MLGDRLGAKVAIQHTAKGKGKLVISYTNLDELDGILEHIK